MYENKVYTYNVNVAIDAYKIFIKMDAILDRLNKILMYFQKGTLKSL